MAARAVSAGLKELSNGSADASLSDKNGCISMELDMKPTWRTPALKAAIKHCIEEGVFKKIGDGHYKMDNTVDGTEAMRRLTETGSSRSVKLVFCAGVARPGDAAPEDEM